MNSSHAKELKRGETESPRSGESLVEAQRLLLAGYWEWNLKTNKYSWCETMYQIFNLAPGQAAPRTGTFFNSVHPEDRDKVVRALGQALVGEAPFHLEHRIVWPDGSVRVVLGKAEVTFAGGRPIRVLGSVQDITDSREVKGT